MSWKMASRLKLSARSRKNALLSSDMSSWPTSPTRRGGAGGSRARKRWAKIATEAKTCMA
eukprot:14270688-Heterocapsa_arctica.AAC.1